MPLVLTGTAVTFDDDRRIVPAAAVYINDDRIEAVQPARNAAPAGYGRATRVAVNGLIYPGLVDLHNHLAYNFLPLWSAPKDDPYTSRYQWPGAPTYGRDISNPAQAMGIAAAAAALRYAEVKAVVGGVTAIQGSPPVTRPFPGWMVRNIEKEVFADRPKQVVFQSVLNKTEADLKKQAKQLTDGRAFIYHLAEGTDPKLRAEYTAIEHAGCAVEGLVGIHSTALTAADFKAWRKKAGGGGAVVWSPFSNLWLYGDTTDVMAARAHGMRVCLGSDWSPSGTRNLLGELKVAQIWNEFALAGKLTAQDLCEMATREAGLTLEAPWGRPVGRLVEGGLADVAVFTRRHPDPYANLLAATERGVRLVMVGGVAVYGLASLLKSLGSPGESVTVAGQPRALRMKLPADRQPDEPDVRAAANLSWKGGLARMRAVQRDPAGEVRKARRNRAFGVTPLEFTPDMPGPGNVDERSRELTDDELDQLVIPPIEPIAHDRAWFDAVDAGHPHAAVLRELRAAFSRRR